MHMCDVTCVADAVCCVLALAHGAQPYTVAIVRTYYVVVVYVVRRSSQTQRYYSSTSSK